MKIQKVLVQKVKTYKYLPEVIVESEELDDVEVDEMLSEENDSNNDYIFIRAKFKNIEIYNEFGEVTSEKFKLTIVNEVIECCIESCTFDYLKDKYRIRMKVLGHYKLRNYFA